MQAPVWHVCGLCRGIWPPTEVMLHWVNLFHKKLLLYNHGLTFHVANLVAPCQYDITSTSMLDLLSTAFELCNIMAEVCLKLNARKAPSLLWLLSCILLVAYRRKIWSWGNPTLDPHRSHWSGKSLNARYSGGVYNWLFQCLYGMKM